MDHRPMRTLAVRKMFDSGKWVSVEHHEVELPGGRVIPDWPWIKTPDYINVVPVTPDGQLLLFRQYKYAFKEPSLALVGGYIEPGEEPLAAAQRELLMRPAAGRRHGISWAITGWTPTAAWRMAISTWQWVPARSWSAMPMT
jgi:hypothetical protein